jgi:dipeptidyl aminopeptidase/acylaminoacyl peptidase
MAVDLRVASHVSVAPDGGAVAFCVAPIGHRDRHPTRAIYVVQADGGDTARPLTGNEHNNTAPRWAPDGRAIAFLSDRVERGELQLHVVAANGGEPLRLTSLKGGVDNPSWHPDGRSIAFTTRRRALDGESEPDSDVKVASERWRPKAIALVPATGGAPRLIGPARVHVWGFAFSPAGERVAALVSDTEDLAASWDNVRLVVFSTSGDAEPERELLRLTGFPGAPRWSPDGRLLALVGSRLPDADAENVFVIDVESGDVAILDDRGTTPSWAAFDGHDLLVHVVDGQRTRIDRTDPRGDEWEHLSFSSEAGAGWIEHGVNIDVAGGTLAFTCAQPTRPPDVYAASIGAGATRLTDLNPPLDGIALAPMEALTWRASDGREVSGWLLLPVDRPTETAVPLVAAIHGGPSWQWGNWFHGTWHDWGQLLAARGFAVLLPNPRGSTGRGAGFTGVNRFDFGGGDFDDIMTGIDMLIARGVADPQRLGICGWSFGGFMTAWAVTHTDRFKAAVAGAAPTNWISKIGTTDIRPFNEWNLGAVNSQADIVWERSPLRYVRHASTPTLILQGEADARVPPGQAWEFYNALRAQGVDTELVIYPRQGHQFDERAHQLDLLNRLLGWFEKYMGEPASISQSPASMTQ